MSELLRATRSANPLGLARALLAVGSLSTLLLTRSADLFVTFAPGAASARCVGIGKYGLFCLSQDLTASRSPATVAAICVLLAVLTGWGGRVLAVPHFYTAWSISQNIVLVEGGDQVNAVVTMLLIPWLFSVPMGNCWRSRTDFLGSLRQNAFAYGAAELIRLQLTIIYLIAAVAKLAVPQWADGTALWYWLQAPTFGLPPDVFAGLAPLLELPLVMVAATYAVMVFELLIAASIWAESRFSRTVLSAGIVFHFGIAVVLGLWSFGVTMAAAILLCRALSKADVFFITGGRRGGRPLLTTREVQP